MYPHILSRPPPSCLGRTEHHEQKAVHQSRQPYPLLLLVKEPEVESEPRDAESSIQEGSYLLQALLLLLLLPCKGGSQAS